MTPGPATRWWQEPFLHFIALGTALLGVYLLVSPPRPQAAGDRIALTADDLRQIEVAWTAKWQRRPTQAEMLGLVEAKVREEVLYREALAMGLDQGDAIVKRRLAQKLEFLTEDVSAIRAPTQAELAAWHARNATQFAEPGRISFRHVYFSSDHRGARSSTDASATLVALSGADPGPRDAATLGDPFFDRDYYAERTPEQVAAMFGTRFADALFRLRPGAWQGPVESGLGWHLVRIEALVPGRVPTFAEVDRDAVATAWVDERRNEFRRAAYAAMRAKYEVVLPGAPAQ